MNLPSRQPGAAAGALGRSRPYVVFAFLALLYCYPFMRTGPRATDEGTLIYGAVRVAEGQVPTRDFFEGVGPGTFYWLALYFKVFGTTWLATRVSLLITSISIATLMYFLTRRLQVSHAAAPVVLFAATSFGVIWPSISHHVDSTLFALLAFAGFVSWLDSRSRNRFHLLLIGALAGLTTCFLQQKGLLLFLSFVFVLWCLRRGEAGFRPFLAWLGAGYLAVGVCVLGLFYSAGALRSLVYVDAIFPLTRYGNVNSVPYGTGIFGFYWNLWAIPLNKALFPAIGYPVAVVLMTPFLFVAGLPVLLAALALKDRDAALNRLTLPYWVSGAALWISELQRKDIYHLVYGSPLLIILCFYLCGRVRKQWSIRAIRLVAACAGFLAIFNLLVVSMAQTPIVTRRGVIYGYRSDPVLEYLKAHIRPDEEILEYPFRPIYYFLLGARNATRYSFFWPGYNTESQFREAVGALESKKIAHVIWDPTFEEAGSEWAFPHKAKTPIIEPYLNEHYTTVYTGNGVRLLERKK